MTTKSITSRLASDGLQQHMFSAPTAVAEACKPGGKFCTSSLECCSDYCRHIRVCASQENT